MDILPVILHHLQQVLLWLREIRAFLIGRTEHPAGLTWEMVKPHPGGVTDLPFRNYRTGIAIGHQICNRLMVGGFQQDIRDESCLCKQAVRKLAQC